MSASGMWRQRECPLPTNTIIVQEKSAQSFFLEISAVHGSHYISLSPTL